MRCDCSRCQTEGCNANDLCPCCLKAEVDRLTAAIQRVRELLDEEQRGYNPPLGLISRIKTALIGPIHPDDGDKR